MDKMDRLLHSLPGEAPSSVLSAAIFSAVVRRHRRRQVVRRVSASLIALLGLWLVWPAIAWLSASAPYASGAPWLLGGMDYLQAQSVEMANLLWTSAFSVQSTIGSSLEFSTWLGAFLLCCSIFLALDLGSWQLPSRPQVQDGNTTVSARSLHV